MVENQVEEQRKLCDGYKASVEKQEALIEKIRAEKTSAEEALLAMKLEISKKEVTYKVGKEKAAEMQTRLYEIEDKFSTKTNEMKKVGLNITRTSIASVGCAVNSTQKHRIFHYLKRYKQNPTFRAKVLRRRY